MDGSGITVGILSDSFDAVRYPGGVDGVARDISTGDLPANTRVLEDSSGEDEGRGMAQLVHDIAPGAGIQFATANGGEAHFANNIRLLANSGSDVIVDDIRYLAEPFYQDGVAAQAVNAVAAQGVPYFSSSGNYADQAYESAFVDSGQTGGPFNSELHDFDPGPGVTTHQQVDLPVGGVMFLVFQWDQSFRSVGGPGSASDVDISILGADGTTVLTGAYAINNGGDAIEITGLINDGSFDLDSNNIPDTTFYIQVELYSGPAPGLMKYINFGDGTFVTFDTKSATNAGHANAAGGIGVAASAYLATPAFGVDPPLLNDFSSSGGTPILFDTAGNRLASPIDRTSPQITGVDGTNTTFFGFDISQDNDAFPNFFGTSAAAPHVAAVAALMLQATGGPHSVSPQTIYDALESTAIDIAERVDVFGNLATTPIPNGQGFDRYSGFGLVDAAAAIQYLRSQVNIQDVTHLEGDSGTTSYVFNVTFLGGIATPVLVAYTTADVTATAPDDYGAMSGTLTFTPGGVTTHSITVLVVGDLTVEDNETFLVKINVTGARALRSEAVGTILNDDIDISINDVQIVEGDSGTTNAVFTVSTFGAVNQTVKVNYVTGDGTATAPATTSRAVEHCRSARARAACISSCRSSTTRSTKGPRRFSSF